MYRNSVICSFSTKTTLRISAKLRAGKAVWHLVLECNVHGCCSPQRGVEPLWVDSVNAFMVRTPSKIGLKHDRCMLCFADTNVHDGHTYRQTEWPCPLSKIEPPRELSSKCGLQQGVWQDQTELGCSWPINERKISFSVNPFNSWHSPPYPNPPPI